MKTKYYFAHIIACGLVATFMATSAEAQFAKLVKRIPDSVNTVILLNAEKIFNSEIALREGWKTNFEKAIAGGLTRLPADTQQYVMASQTDFEFMHPVWQLGLISTSGKHDMVYIAKKQKGTLDTIVGLPAVLLPSTNYLVQLGPTTYGTMIPASRQAVARWIQSTADDTPEFSPYITEAIGFSDESGTEIILAMDLTNVLDLTTVRKLVKESKMLSSAGVDGEAVSKVLTSLRGITLGITFGETSFGSIKVDFGEDAGVLKGLGKKLLLEALAKQGAMIDDFAKWDGKVDGKQLRLSGRFSSTGMRQVFSLMDPPTASAIPTESKDGQGAGAQDSKVVATQKYFVAVNQYIRDIRNKEPQRIAQYGIWFDKYARKIDQLPLLNVDEDMLNYGAYVAQQFRNAGAAIKGIGVRSRVRQVEGNNSIASSGYSASGGGYNYEGTYYGGWGVRGSYTRGNRAYGYGPATAGAQVAVAQQAGLRAQQRMGTQVRVQEKAKGTSAARAIMNDIDGATAKVRRDMTQKYNVEFNEIMKRGTGAN